MQRSTETLQPKNIRQPLAPLVQQPPLIKSASTVKQPIKPALASRYAQGIYQPSSVPSIATTTNNYTKIRSHSAIMEDEQEIGPLQKRVKTTVVAKAPLAPLKSTTTNTILAAKLSLKEKQILKEKRARKTGVVPTHKAPRPIQQTFSGLGPIAQARRESASGLTRVHRRDSHLDRLLPDQDRSLSSMANSSSQVLIELEKPIKRKTNSVVPSTVIKTKTLLRSSAKKENSILIETRLTKIESTKLVFPGPVLKKSPFLSLKKALAVEPLKKRRGKRLALLQDPIQALEYEENIYDYWREIEVLVGFFFIFRFQLFLILITCLSKPILIGECDELWPHG
jgi:hypothetical protein